MDYDAVVASAVRDWPHARQFQGLFPNAEHTIVEAQRDFDPDGWKPVREWISRAHLHDRYVVWLVVAIEIARDGTLSQLEEPTLYVIEVEKVVGGKDEEDFAKWEAVLFKPAEGDWEKLVESGGDFASVELEMTVDAPVDRFATFWNDTRPRRSAEASQSVLIAPIRFLT